MNGKKDEKSRPHIERLKSDFLDSSSGLGITSQSYIPPILGNSSESEKSKSRSNSAPASTESYALTKQDETLISAIQKRNIKEIDAAIDTGGNVNAVDSSGRAILFHCNDAIVMQHLVSKFNANIFVRTPNNWTLLHYFGNKGNRDIVHFLIDNKLDVNAKAQFDITPLRAAIMGERVDVVKLLLSKNALIDDPHDSEGVKSALHEACTIGNPAIVKLLLEYKANINSRCKPYNQTPIQEAAFKGHLEVVQLLVEHKADINTKDATGYNALYYSCANGHTEVTEYLLKSGANVKEIYKKSSQTIFHAAASKGTKETITILLKYFREGINIKDENGNTPLHIACHAGNKEAAEALIRAGADLKVKNSENASPEDIAKHKKKEKFSPTKSYTKEDILRINKGRLAIVKFIEEMRSNRVQSPEIKDKDFIEGKKLLVDEAKAPEAIKKFSASIKKNPKNSWGYVYRAAAHKASKDSSKALNDITKAITLDQNNPDLYNTRAVIHFENEDMEGAIDDLMTAVKVDPQYPTGYKNLATVLFQTGNFDEAYENYLTAVKLENPKFRPPSSASIPPVVTSVIEDKVKLTKHKQYRILSIDGGGVRALIPALILKEIEQKVHKPIAELFDFFAGTSSGAVTCLGLSKPSKLDPLKPYYSAADICELYSNPKNAKRLYQGFAATDMKKLFMSKYSRAGIDGLMDEYLGDIRLSKVLPHNLLATSYEINSHSAWNLTKREAILHPDKDFAISDVARASSAAPTFFDPAVVKDRYVFLDGGLFANNPCLCAYLESQQYAKKEDLFVLSLGTGESTPLAKDVKKHANYWMMHLFTFVSLGTTSNTDNYMRMIFPEKEDVSQQYFRLQARMSKKIALDGVSREEVQVLTDTAKELVESDQLKRVIEKLLAEE